MPRRPDNYRPDPWRPPRPSAAKRGYGRRWRAARLRHLAAHPACVHCGRPAAHVDHILPHRGDARLFWRPSNWQSLCASCHGAKTQAGQ